MKKVLLTGVLSLMIGFGYSQDEFDGSIKWGTPVELSKKEYGPIAIGVSNSDFYAYKSKKKNYTLMTFDLDRLTVDSEHPMILEYDGNDLNLRSTFIFGDMMVALTTYYDKASKEINYQIQELKPNGQFGKPVQLGSFEKSKGLMASKTSAGGRFKMIVSDDRESMMVYSKKEDDSGNPTYETVLLDKNLEEVGRQEMEIPFERFHVSQGRLSNTGRFYMVGYEAEEEEKGVLKRSVLVKGDYHLLVHDCVNGEFEDVSLDIGKDITSVGIKVMDDESTYIYGMFSNELAKGVSGSFFVKFDPERNEEFSSKDEFEEDFITQHWSNRQKKKAEKKKDKGKEEPALYSYIMHDLVIKDNGDIMLLAEQYYMYVTTTTHYGANGSTYTTTTYHYVYNDILAVNCTGEGEITWKQKIKKRQHTTNDGGYLSSFFTMVQGDNVFLIYNDKEANMDEAEEAVSKKEQKKMKRNTVAAIITINEDGDVARNTLFDFEGEESRTLVPKRCEKMSDNEMLIFTEAGRRQKLLGWVTL